LPYPIVASVSTLKKKASNRRRHPPAAIAPCRASGPAATNAKANSALRLRNPTATQPKKRGQVMFRR